MVRLGRGRVAHRSGDARMGSDRAEAPGARVWPKTARSRRGTGGKAGRGARSPKTRSVTSSARRRRAPSERGRCGQGGEGGSPSWTIGVRACRLRSRRGRRERGVEIHGAGGALHCRSLNRRHGRNETTGSGRSIRGSGDFPEIPLVAANDSDWTSYDAPAQRTQNLEFVRLTSRCNGGWLARSPLDARLARGGDVTRASAASTRPRVDHIDFYRQSAWELRTLEEARGRSATSENRREHGSRASHHAGGVGADGADGDPRAVRARGCRAPRRIAPLRCRARRRRHARRVHPRRRRRARRRDVRRARRHRD